MKLRDYQQAAVAAVINTWKTARSCLIVLPTGCGKTVVFGEVIRRLLAGEIGAEPRRAMILAHREELIRQAEDKVGAISGGEVRVEMGAEELEPFMGKWPQVVVSTVQTQITGRMRKFSPADFSALIIDEAHHATSRSYRKCVDHYLANPGCRLLGVTATPDRADQLALGNVFETVAYEYTTTEAISDGWLVPVRQKLVKVGSLDYSKISTCAGDFNQGELAEVLEEEKNLHGIASPTIEICGDKRAIIFATTVRQAERIAEIINRTRPDKAAWICGKTPKQDRHDTLNRFRDGELQFVVNVGVLTEGFDDSGVEVVVMARPTKSRALYAQMAGRATRPAAEIAARLGEVGSGSEEVGMMELKTNEDSAIPNSKLKLQTSASDRSSDAAARRRQLIASSSKPSCLIVDFVGNSGRHKLITSLDILGGKALDEDEDEATAIVRRRCEESETGIDTLAELEEARRQVKERKLAEQQRRKFITLKAKFTAVSVDPFNPYDVAPPDEQERTRLDRTSLSWKQRQLLRERLGIDPDSLATSDAKAILDEHFNRIKYGLASLKQSRFLRRRGIVVPMTFDDARWSITNLMQKRGR